MNVRELTIGDRLIRTNRKSLTKSHAIYVGVINGRLSIAENTKQKGVVYSPLINFINTGNKIEVIHYGFKKEKQQEILKSINKKIGIKYDYNQYNCKQFADEIIRDKRNAEFILLKTIARIASLFIILFIGQKIQNNG